MRDFAEQEVRPVAEELDRRSRFPYEIVAKLAELGLMGMPFPQEYGGGGADNLSYALAVEELGARGLLGGDHDGRPHVARHLADLRFRLARSRSSSGCRSSAAARSSAPSG